jgi:hypothetical protein
VQVVAAVAVYSMAATGAGTNPDSTTSLQAPSTGTEPANLVHAGSRNPVSVALEHVVVTVHAVQTPHCNSAPSSTT